MLDLACYDFIRIKRVQALLMKEGDFVEFKTRSGQTITKVHEAGYLLNSIKLQFRKGMKKLLLTRKEDIKKSIGIGSKDFANWIDAKDVTGVEVEKKGNTKISKKKL